MGEEKSLYDNQATLLGYTSYKVVQVSLDEQWPDEIKENVTRQYAVGRSRKTGRYLRSQRNNGSKIDQKTRSG